MRISALSLAFVIFAAPLRSSAEDAAPSQLLECDRIFAEWYCAFFFYSPTDASLQRFGQLAEPSKQLKTAADQRKRVRALPIDQQARLVLLVSLGIPLDGEKADFFWSDLFGDRAPEIGRKLRAIDQNEIERLCNWMGVPPSRADGFERHVKKWGDPRFKPMTID